MGRRFQKVPFRTLSKENQNTLRSEYRRVNREHYNYSILLFIMFTIFGVLILLGILACLLDVMLGSLLAVLSLIGFIITSYFLYRSNDKFVRFLNRKGYKYK
jgi:uncharacterized membrane protein YkgB